MRYALTIKFSCLYFLLRCGSKTATTMLSKILLICLASVASTFAEAPLSRLAPYPAAGWRPDKAFDLPAEYLPPREIEAQQLPQQVALEINRQRVDFVGQIQGSTLASANQPQNSYLPPGNSATGDIKMQSLPNNAPAQQFAQRRPQPQRLRPQQFFHRPQNQQQQQQQFFSRPHHQQQQQQQLFSRPPNQQQQFRPQPTTKPNFQQQFLPAVQQQQQFSRPSPQYGAPAEEPFTINYPDPRSNSAQADNGDSDDANRSAIEAINAAIDAYNRDQDAAKGNAEPAELKSGNKETPTGAGYTDVPPATQGEYYVLGPDKRLQLVMYTTSQDEEDARNNGFTAHLKYTPVGEVNAPVFKYNSRGQLVRIFKK